jgi:hypothetical protein
MNKIEEVISKARKAEDVNTEDIVAYIRNYKKIVLRGAGAFGTQIGKDLISLQIPKNKMVYWDVRASELEKVNGLRVTEPFKEAYDKDDTIVINCIPNGSLAGSSVMMELEANGYSNSLSGMALYEAMFCPMDANTGFQSKVCILNKTCNWCCCERLMSLLQKDCVSRRGDIYADELYFNVLTFVISLKCTLGCKHCGQYMNSYPRKERINIPFDRIAEDINRIFDAVDSVGFVSIIGGEPFLHPELNRIVSLLLEKTNFGMIGITTNGICRITPEHLSVLRKDRTRIIFSNYTHTLPSNLRDIFADNVSMVESAGISFTVGVPLWGMPPSLKNQNNSVEFMTKMRSECSSPKTCQTVQNGAYYPCSVSTSIHSHSVADLPSDYVAIDDALSPSLLRERIKAVNDRPYYQSCNYCGDGGQELAFSGEQGLDERYSHLNCRRTKDMKACS